MPRVDGTEIDKDFCLENEWRYTPTLPKNRKCIPVEKHYQEKNELDRYTFYNCLLKFDEADISYIILETDLDCEKLFESLERVEESSNVKKSTFESLKAKVISLERIARDF